jgi:hypothetical protein
MPKQGKPPKGWKLLYQPHPEGRPGLYVCSAACEEKVREAMAKGPIIDPLEMRPPPMPHELQEQVRELVKGVAEDERARAQEEALKRVQEAVDTALIAAMEANDGKPLTKREAIDIAGNAIIDTHCNIGMAVTAKVEIDTDGIATAEVVIIGKRDPRHLGGGPEDHPGLVSQFMGAVKEALWPKVPAAFRPGEHYRSLPLALMPPEPEPDEEQITKEMEFTALERRDTKGVVIDVDFRPVERDDDGENRRKIDDTHNASDGSSHRADSPSDEAWNTDTSGKAKEREESQRDS